MADSIPPFQLPRETSISRSSAVWIAIAAVVIVLLGAGFVLLRHAVVSSSAPHQPTAEEKAYVSKISITGSKMSVAQNYIGDNIYFLDAKVSNQGSRPVSSVDLQLEYTDTLGQVVLRDDAQPITPREMPLQPGVTRAFRVSYDHMPADWNQAPPKVTVTGVSF